MVPHTSIPGPTPADGAPPLEIRVEDVHKSFDSEHVLRGVDLDVRRGELVAVVGASGCGKTVLLEHILGHLAPDRGRVLVADHELPGSPLVDLAQIDETRMNEIRVHCASTGVSVSSMMASTRSMPCALMLACLISTKARTAGQAASSSTNSVRVLMW